ncbi:hypothetical protein [Sphingomonas endophytica]|uniref:hypothetical protein n=1 Tax=Sphingomonas endophytica TaxID=869719 RepID=UPI00187C3BC4|nr:hypothetical protein [Sphingomonas endophytica]
MMVIPAMLLPRDLLIYNNFDWRPLLTQMIFPRFGGHAGLADHALLGLFGREIPEG